MQTFYNKYGCADNNSPHTKFIGEKVSAMSREILAYAEKHDLSLIEVEHWVNRILSSTFCETTMINALKIRKLNDRLVDYQSITEESTKKEILLSLKPLRY